jgi:hypothetical protein
LECDNADHSLFASQHGQLAEICFTHQLFSFSGLIFKAIDRFPIQFRLRKFDLRIVAETASLYVLTLCLQRHSEKDSKCESGRGGDEKQNGVRHNDRSK